MKQIKQLQNEPRSHYLLRVAAAYIEEHNTEGLIEFDDAVCDGNCLVEDILAEINRDNIVGAPPLTALTKN